MKIILEYKETGFGYNWILTTSDGIGLTVDYPVKPTRKQVRKQCKAVRNCNVGDFLKKYSIKKGKML